jgi:ATP-grasp domain
MNVVFLSPHFPPPVRHFCMRLRDEGATVLGLADEPYDFLHPELRHALAAYYRVDDMSRYDDLVRALGWFTHRYGRIDRIESLNEHWLETDARLRTDFNVPGIGLAAIDRIKRKSVMKRVFERAGIPTARGRVCRTEAQTRRFIAEVGYPVIAKPDVGVGAARTYRLDDDAGLAAYLADRPPVDYLVEELIEGRLLTYDGLVDREGAVVFESSLTYATSVLDVVQGGDMTYWIPREIPDDVRSVGRRTLRAFDVRERPFHFEYFRQPDGSLVALEVNMRQPGGLTVDMWNYANEIDFYRAWARVMVHGTAEVATERPFACLWAGRKRGKPYRLSHDEALARAGDRLVMHAPVEPVFAAAIGDEGFILRGPELEDLQAAAAEIQALATDPDLQSR